MQSIFRHVCAFIIIFCFVVANEGRGASARDKKGLDGLKIDRKEKVYSRLLTFLDNSDSNSGFTFAAGLLCVGRSYPKAELELFNSRGTSTKLSLRHNPELLRPYGKDAIIAVGSFENEFKTQHYGYTVIRKISSGAEPIYEKKFEEFSPEFAVTGVAGGPEGLYFSDLGNGRAFSFKPQVVPPGQKAVEYVAAEQEENPDLQHILDIESPGSRLLNASEPILDQAFEDEFAPTDRQLFSKPKELAVKAGFLYALELGSPDPNDDSVGRVPLAGGKTDHLFKVKRKGLLSIIALSEKFPYLVAVESLPKQLLFIHAKSGKLVETMPVQAKAFPVAVTQLGNCLAVLAGKEVQFYDLNSKQLLDSWDLSKYGFALDYPRHITVDPVAKKVFVESQRGCNSCQAKSNGVVEAKQVGSDSTFDKCLSQ